MISCVGNPCYTGRRSYEWVWLILGQNNVDLVGRTVKLIGIVVVVKCNDRSEMYMDIKRNGYFFNIVFAGRRIHIIQVACILYLFRQYRMM